MTQTARKKRHSRRHFAHRAKNPEFRPPMSPDNIQQFIRAHADDDPHRLLLSAHRHPDVPMPYVVGQIEALRKVRDKIPTWHDPALRFPPLLSVEQASSERAARFKASLFSGKKMADLTGGMGVDAFFWAKKFERVTYVEQNAALAELAQHNFAALDATNLDCTCATAEDFLKNGAHFDLLYLDPARRDAQQRKVFRLEDCQPDVLALRDLLLARAPQVLLKTAPLLDLKLATRQLGCVRHIWVLSIDNECKEVLYLLEKNLPTGHSPTLTAACLNGPAEQFFDFDWPEEQAAQAAFSTALDYLYEPDAAVLKAGALKTFAQRFGLSKLHANTQLYTSERLVEGLPARRFRIEAVCKYERRAVQQAVPSGKANVATRNFPDSVAQIRQKLGLADGGDCYLFAATDADNRKVILVCQKV
jgi:hypothetical protein